MEENNTALIPANNSDLVKVSNSLAITNKLLVFSRGYNIVLFNEMKYLKEKEVELSILRFIKNNFWYFINPIVNKIKKNDFQNKPVSNDTINILKSNKYEYPRNFYRKRYDGVVAIDSKYDKMIKENMREYLYCPPPLDNKIKSEILNFVNHRIAGYICSEFSETSIGKLIGIETNVF